MPEPNPEVVKYILEARQRGFEDYEIRIPLTENGWNLAEIQAAFELVKKEEDRKLKKKIIKENKTVYVYKNSMTIHLDSRVLEIIEKRAKKNMLTAEEQVEDIIRRSCVNRKKNAEVGDNVDDLFLKLFSRKNTGKAKVKK